MSVNEFSNLPIYCASLPGYTWQCGLEDTGINLQTLQDKNMILLIDKNLRGGISSIMGDRYVIFDENKKIIYIEANNFYGHSMSQLLPFDEIEFETSVNILHFVLKMRIYI